jgi:hypothetical protein
LSLARTISDRRLFSWRPACRFRDPGAQIICFACYPVVSAARPGRRTGGSSPPHRLGGRRSGRAHPARRRHPRRGLPGRAARGPQLAQAGIQLVQVGGSHDLVHPGDESPAAAASARVDTPSARSDASAQVRSRSARSTRHAARGTRSSTRRCRRRVAVRSAICMHSACPTCSVQQGGHAGVFMAWFLPAPPYLKLTSPR